MFKYLCLCPSSFAKWVQLTVCIQLWLKCEKSLINRAAQNVFKVCCCVGYVDAFCLFLQNNQRMLPKVIDWLLIDFLSASECSNIGLMSELGQVFLRSMWRILCLPNRKISQMKKGVSLKNYVVCINCRSKLWQWSEQKQLHVFSYCFSINFSKNCTLYLVSIVFKVTVTKLFQGFDLGCIDFIFECMISYQRIKMF